MCGIAGIFSEKPLNEAILPGLENMASAIAHRGPDGHGIKLYPHAALVHTRLSIIDIQQGAQPMCDSSGRYTITFNGEIYNYRLLRKELSSAGVQFKTQSDTEVILALWREHGVEGLARMRGMFALAIWDAREQEAVLVRDPCGIKPLFISSSNNGQLVFASEAKAIFALNGVRPSLDESSLHLLMNFRYLPGDRSLFSKVKQVAPGSVVRCKLAHNKLVVESSVIEFSSGEASADTLAQLRESIQSHLVSDVEVGAYLSGGIDSASIVALSGQSLRTFTLAVGDDPDEVENARKSARILGVSNRVGHIPDDRLPDIHHLVTHLEVPKVNSLQVGELASIASEEVKVVLSGLGGDELYLGYNAHRIMYMQSRLSRMIPAFTSRPLGRAVAGMISMVRRVPWTESERAARMFASSGHWSVVYGILRNVWDNPGMRKSIYGPRMLDTRLTNSFGYLEENWPKQSDPVLAMQQFENRHKLVNDLLWQEDRLSMAHGLEVRVPFVDYQLRQQLAGWSLDELMPGGKEKGGMRKLLQPVLPAEILNRPKSGFQVAAGQFFQRYLGQLAKTYLSREKVVQHGLFNPVWVERSMRLPPVKAYRWHYFILYLMLLTHIWIELFEQDTWQSHL